jgi:asparagine synthase (glutamine-hydrolysing)
MNGEIYNYRELRADLRHRGHEFSTDGDTEVIVHLYEEYGTDCVRHLHGMFAFSLWDERRQQLLLARDRVGKKPLLYDLRDGVLTWASEMHALLQNADIPRALDPVALDRYLAFGYVPTPRSALRGVSKLPPAHTLLFRDGKVTLERYWQLDYSRKLDASVEELGEMIRDALLEATRKRMIADVPLGAFLSGGIDSSTVAALMKAANAGPVKTFTIGFDIAGFDEAPHAAAVARHLGTEHTELTVTAQQALDVIPQLPEYYDEPFADSSQIPTYLVSAMTRKHVKVALSGDGGDELFAGYNRYQLTQRFWRGMSLLPRGLRQGIAAALTSVSPDRWSRLLSFLPARLPTQVGGKLHKAASVLALPDGDAVYRRLITHWEPNEVMPGTAEPKGILWDPSLAAEMPSLLDRMQFLDLVTYLPDDILTKVDRASMAVALEARVPLLDHRVVEFAWALPRPAKIRGGKSKWLLRQVLYRHVPPELVERPKMGFGIPLGEWLRGPLRDWAETLLAEKRLREAGFFDTTCVRRHWAEHLSGHRNWQYLLWDVLMFEAWRERWAHG